VCAAWGVFVDVRLRRLDLPYVPFQRTFVESR
jgi:hypothetical protein